MGESHDKLDLRTQMPEAAAEYRADLQGSIAVRQPVNGESRNILENVIHSTVSLVVGENEPGTKPSRFREEGEHYAAEILKNVPLFLKPSKAAFAGVALLHGLGQARTGDRLQEQSVDFLSGATKGVALKGVFDRVGPSQLNFAAKGVVMGTTSRGLETGLNRRSYLDANGDFQLSTGFSRTMNAIASKEMLASDVLVFGAANALTRGSTKLFGDRLTRSPMAMTVTTAGTFGFVAGANGEIMRQKDGGQPIEWGDVFLRGTLEAGAMSISAVAGNKLQARMDARLASRNSPVNQLPEYGLVNRDSRVDGLRQKTQERLATEFPKRTAAEQRILNEQGKSELLNAKIEAPDGSYRNVHDLIMSDAGVPPAQRFTTAQKERIVSAYSEIGEALKVRQRTTGDGEQGVTLVHTQGELGRVLEYARLKGLDAKTTEKALLASMFSDSVKMSNAAGPANANFFAHHLDGAMAAEQVLAKHLGKDFTATDLAHVVAAAREHQIGPPGFMSTLYAGIKIPNEVSVRNGKVLEELSGRTDLTDAQKSLVAEFSALKAEKKPLMTAEERSAIASLKEKLADPFNQKQKVPDSEYFIVSPNGARELFLTPREADMLALSGAGRRWYVPYEKNAWHEVTRSVINGDSIDNYFTGSGISKFVAIRGPKTFFPDKVIAESIESVTGSKGSGPDSLSVMTPEALAMANALKPRMEAHVESANKAVELWLSGQKLDPASTPYWKAPLDYKEAPLVPGELTASQSLAIRIRERMVEELRRTGRVNADQKPSFEPVLQTGQ
jgi:hypothetical protein